VRVESNGEAPLPERPAGEETPAETERLPAGPLAEEPAEEDGIAPLPVSGSPLMQGTRTAATITGGSLALEGVALLANRLTGGHQAVTFFVLGLAIAGAGFLLLVLAAGRLPKRAQPPFWAMGTLFVSICFLLAGQACGLF